MMNWYFIVNPSAGRGKTGRRWPTYLPRLQAAFPTMEWTLTTQAGEARALAAQAVKDGRTQIVAVGGDGTHHEVINGLVDANGLDQVTYALLPVGSGNDWVRTHQIPHRLNRWIKLVNAQKTAQQRLGRVTYFLNNQPQSRVFANVAGLAYDAYVVHRTEKTKFKNRFIYPLLTLFYLKDFTTPYLRLTYNDEPPIEDRFYTINVGICKYSGGGMSIVPQAKPNGEQFALTFARHLSIPKILLQSWRFYTQSIGEIREVTTTFALDLKVAALNKESNVELEADGEWLGYGPVEFRLLDERLRFVSPCLNQ